MALPNAEILIIKYPINIRGLGLNKYTSNKYINLDIFMPKTIKGKFLIIYLLY